MKELLKIAAAVTVVAPAALGLGLLSVTRIEVSVHDAALFRTGDILFVRGTSWRSRIVLLLDWADDDFSHVGLVRLVDRVPYIIHATPSPAERAPGGSVRVESLNEFLSPKRVTQAALYRLRSHSQRTADSAASVAATYAAKKVPFDHEFSLSSDDELYCTELILRAYGTAGLDLLDSSSEALLLPTALSANHQLIQIARFP